MKTILFWILEFVLSKLKEWAVSLLEVLKKDSEDKKENEELRENLENSQSEEEQYDATEDLARKLRGRG